MPFEFGEQTDLFADKLDPPSLLGAAGLLYQPPFSSTSLVMLSKVNSIFWAKCAR
jgi:hypothetical protein